MNKQQQRIECVLCGETRCEQLSEEESEKIAVPTSSIYRQCGVCGKMTSWISSRLSAAKDLSSRRTGNLSLNNILEDSHPQTGHERMATQAERDKVNSMVCKD